MGFKFRSAFILFFVLMVSTSTKGEYRAFLLQIKGPPPEIPGTEQSLRLVKSSLDPWQYVGYYPLMPGETVTYIDTWRCTGRTGGMQPICKSPKEVAAEKAEEEKSQIPGTNRAAVRTPASQNPPTVQQSNSPESRPPTK